MDIFVINLIATAVLYCAPIIFLRYALFKRRIKKKKALAFIVVWALIVFSGIRIYTNYKYGATSTNTYPAMFWSVINYGILADDERKENEDINADDSEENKEPGWFKSNLNKIRNLTYKSVHFFLVAYSVIITVFTIIFLCLTIRYYNEAKKAKTYSHPDYHIDSNGNIYKLEGYYSSEGELIPFNK